MNLRKNYTLTVLRAVNHIIRIKHEVYIYAILDKSGNITKFDFSSSEYKDKPRYRLIRKIATSSDLGTFWDIDRDGYLTEDYQQLKDFEYAMNEWGHFREVGI